MDKWTYLGLSRDMQNFYRTMEDFKKGSSRPLDLARAQEPVAHSVPHGSAGSSSGGNGAEVLAGIIGLVSAVWIFVQLSATPVGGLVCAVIGWLIVSVIARVVLNNLGWVLVIGGGLLLVHFWH